MCRQRNIKDNNSNLFLFGADVDVQFGLHCRPKGGAFNPEGADQPMTSIFCYLLFVTVLMFMTADLKRKKTISTPLMMEKPVRSPMVPPMRLRLDLFVSLDIIKGGRVKVYLNQLKSGWGQLFTWMR